MMIIVVRIRRICRNRKRQSSTVRRRSTRRRLQRHLYAMSMCQPCTRRSLKCKDSRAVAAIPPDTAGRRSCRIRSLTRNLGGPSSPPSNRKHKPAPRPKSKSAPLSKRVKKPQSKSNGLCHSEFPIRARRIIAIYLKLNRINR